MNTVARWNPFRELDDVFSRFGQLSGEHLARSEWLPPVDISETETHYLIDVELPAVASENVEVAVKDGVLMVSGERHLEQAVEGKRHRVERQYGRFARSFRLPEDVDEEHIEAAMKDGVLHLRVTKRAKEGPRRIEIQRV